MKIYFQMSSYMTYNAYVQEAADQLPKNSKNPRNTKTIPKQKQKQLDRI